MNCKHCGAELHPEANFCMKCGAKAEKEVVCHACGTKLPEGAAFCFKCGAKQGAAVEDTRVYDCYISNTDEFNQANWSGKVNKAEITSAKVEEGVTVCPSFYNCRNLREVSLPSTLQRIGHQGFCLTAVERLVIPDSVTKIGNHAFEDCKNLKYVKMSANIASISQFAFIGCSALEIVEYRGSYMTGESFMNLMAEENKTFFFE